MPLRIAEKDGFLYAVNKCVECPFIKHISIDEHRRNNPNTLFPNTVICKRDSEKRDIQHSGKNCIPVWCPLPTHLDHMLMAPAKTMTEFMVRQENEEAGLRCKKQLDKEVEDLLAAAIEAQMVLQREKTPEDSYVMKDLNKSISAIADRRGNYQMRGKHPENIRDVGGFKDA